MKALACLFVLIPCLAALGGDPEALKQYDTIQETLAGPKTELTAAVRKALFREVSNHPVTALSSLFQYDPEGIIGFCFGRAMGAHLMARRRGLSKNSVRKLFIIGDLRAGSEPEWRFHVTTLVKGEEDGGWQAIDPIMTPPLAPGGPLPLQEWVRIVKKTWDKADKAKLYLASSDAVMPDVKEDPHGTTGDHILEDIFDPAAKAGFRETHQGPYTVWETTPAAEEAYLISVRETSDRFRFDGITVAGQFYDYRSYFLDLLRDLSKGPPVDFPDEKRMRQASLPVKASLHSPRWFPDFWRIQP